MADGLEQGQCLKQATHSSEVSSTDFQIFYVERRSIASVLYSPLIVLATAVVAGVANAAYQVLDAGFGEALSTSNAGRLPYDPLSHGE